MTADARQPAAIIRQGRTALGIELGSTRIKACLVDLDDPAVVLATGSHSWQNRYVDGRWTYSLTEVWAGVQAAYADLVGRVQERSGVRPDTFGVIGVSAMMHGYLAFDGDGELLVPFRTWRTTTTQPAASELTAVLGVNIPLRWSIAHLHQAVLDGEPHVDQLRLLTTLAGYVHWRLTGRAVLGVGDASGMFPIDSATGDYDSELLARYDRLAGRSLPVPTLAALLPKVLAAGDAGGELTAQGSVLLDPSGHLRPGIPFCPPEGDAGTGMVATNSVAPRTGNVSAGTSIFAMVVLETPLTGLHREVDLVTTPVGDAVAMVHCNNGASELAGWAGIFRAFTAAAGAPLDGDTVFALLLQAALAGDADGGGLIAYNHLAGEPIVGLLEGRPLLVRTPESSFTLANFARAQLYGVFGTLALGMSVLADEGVAIDRLFAHGGLFSGAVAPQRFLAAALDTPVSVGTTAAQGGAWGIAVLAAYQRAVHLAEGSSPPALHTYLDATVFARIGIRTVEPSVNDVEGFAQYLRRYRAGLAIEAAATSVL